MATVLDDLEQASDDLLKAARAQFDPQYPCFSERDLARRNRRRGETSFEAAQAAVGLDPPDVTLDYLAGVLTGEIIATARRNGLSTFDVDVLVLRAKGFSSREIAAVLDVAPGTVLRSLRASAERIEADRWFGIASILRAEFLPLGSSWWRFIREHRSRE